MVICVGSESVVMVVEWRGRGVGWKGEGSG